MVAFEIHINGERVCVAGLEEFGVVTAFLCRARHRNSAPVGHEEELFIDVGGLESSSRETLKWLKNRPIFVGDEIIIRILETTAVDTPISRERDDPERVLRSKEEYVRRCAAELGWKIVTGT